MKPSIVQRLKARLAVARHKKKQGVAILTVLAIITLMTVLVVSFFNMATSAKVTAKGSVEIQRVTTLKDTIINLVIAQFREASNLTPTNASSPRDIITWISQPGAIRTFSGTDVSKNRLYKLYSSNVPQIGDIRPYETGRLLADINEDNVADWAERPDEFTDMNRPVYTASSADRARTAQGGLDLKGFAYPIVDPRAYNGRTGTQDLLKNTEGFSYSEKSGSKVILGIDPAEQQLAMPVRWIYILQDGTLGYLDESKSFRTLNGAEGGKISRENPIVGRIAWWADDESCKVNVNTASIPAAWDTPRTTSKEDQWLAQSQPVAGEFQRYPGHPATVDLSAVFYPNRRWVPDPLVTLLAGSGQEPAGGKKSLLSLQDAARIWDLAPFISSDAGQVGGGTVGTASGQLYTPPPGINTVAASNDDRLFTSLDEMYFKASGAINKSLNSPRSNLLSEGKDAGQEFLTTLERSQFFLTHKSHSPELTNQGFPRVSMFPMDLLAVPAVGGTGALPTGVSPYDVTMALNSTIGAKSSIVGGNAYFFQRRDPTSRHNEIANGSDSRQRNYKIAKYLVELSKLPIPGYPDAVPIKINVPAVSAQDPDGLSFASKYPPGLTGSGTTAYAGAFGPSSSLDASDRTQILFNMLDYTRSINMQPAFLSGADKYDDGFGKASGICGCDNASGSPGGGHANALSYATQTSRTPRGTGKVYGASEIAVVINVAAKREGGAASDPVSGPWAQLAGQMSQESRTRADSPEPGTRYIVEVGFMVGSFNPKQGWSPTFPTGGISVSSGVGLPTGDSLPGASKLPIVGPGNERLSNLAAVTFGARPDGSAGNDRLLPKGPTPGNGVMPLGGMGGPRASVTFTTFPAGNSTNIARLRPYCVVLRDNPGGGGVPVDLTADPNEPLRIMVTDGVNGSDITQAIDLSLPLDFFTGVQPVLTNESLSTLVTKYANGPPAGLAFPDNRLFLRSFVVPHGDYRLTCTPARVDADVFVPHYNYDQGANSQMAHSFFEMNSNPSNRSMQGSLYNPVVSLMDFKQVPKYPTAPGKLAGLPLPYPSPRWFGANSLKEMKTTQPGIVKFPSQDLTTVKQASMNLLRQETFAHARRDGRGVVPHRGSSDPAETGDFDTGVGATPDGPYMNYPDEGDRRRTVTDAYYRRLFITVPKTNTDGVGGQNISPNFLVRSPVDFGSIPTGVMNRVPWQTLRFRPDIGMNNAAFRMSNVNSLPPPGMPFANFCGPRDHFFLDMFWMPVVEPWSISEPFSTKGTINLNQQIFPFMYIERTTALHALLRGERMYAIPNTAADKYKNVNPANGDPAGGEDATYRRFINAKETVRQFTRRYQQGTDFDPIPAQGNTLAFNCFRSASEICEMWLVPEESTTTSLEATLEKVIGTMNASGQRTGFWTDHALTGDNLRERPYANIYPRVTVRSNVFRLHLIAQTLQKATSEDPTTFDSTKDSVTAEWRGSCMIERSIDPRDPLLANKDYTNLNATTINPTTTPKLDRFYTYRVTEVKQLTQ